MQILGWGDSFNDKTPAHAETANALWLASLRRIRILRSQDLVKSQDILFDLFDELGFQPSRIGREALFAARWW